jgi:hypothetical protein
MQTAPAIVTYQSHQAADLPIGLAVLSTEKPAETNNNKTNVSAERRNNIPQTRFFGMRPASTSVINDSTEFGSALMSVTITSAFQYFCNELLVDFLIT